MNFYKGKFSDIASWLNQAVIEVKTLVNNPPKPALPADVKKVKYQKQTATEIRANEDYILSDELPKNLCNSPCPIDIEYEGDCGDSPKGFIPKDGSEQVEDTLHYADPVAFTKDNQLINRRYVEQLLPNAVNQCSNTPFISNGQRNIIIAPPRSYNESVFNIWITTKNTYTFLLIGGGGSGASMVGHHWETINALLEGGRAGQVHIVTIEVEEGDRVEIKFGRGGTPVTATYDNTVQDSAPYYSIDGNSGEASELTIYKSDGSIRYSATASGGAGGSAVSGVKRATECSTSPYTDSSFEAYNTNLYYPVLVEYEQTNTHFALYASENSCLKAGVQPTYSLAQGVNDLVAEQSFDFRYNNEHYGIGGRGCFNGFDKTDSQVFTATSGRGGRGAFRMVGVNCDKI